MKKQAIKLRQDEKYLYITDTDYLTWRFKKRIGKRVVHTNNKGWKRVKAR